MTWRIDDADEVLEALEDATTRSNASERTSPADGRSPDSMTQAAQASTSEAGTTTRRSRSPASSSAKVS